MNIVPYSDKDILQGHPRRELRDLSRDAFIAQYASGSLRKSAKLGFDVQEAYLQERVRFEFGQGFECLPISRTIYSDPKFVPGQPITELCWHLERMIELRPFETDDFRAKSIQVEYETGKEKHGIGIWLETTSAAWIPKGYAVFAIVTQWQDGKYQPAINPF